MVEYKDCIAINSGHMPTHTLIINNEFSCSIFHENNLNYGCISNNPDYLPFAAAFDRQGNKYTLFRSKAGIMAVIDEYIKPLTIPEIIAKYNLQLSVDEYKRIFNIL